MPAAPIWGRRHYMARRRLERMCRSIKTLREPYTDHVTNHDIDAAALQYVRKVSGFHSPAAHNAEAFNRAVTSVAAATQTLLDQLEVRGARR
jgi:hypothetical protein